jgi:hypothetical protein
MDPFQRLLRLERRPAAVRCRRLLDARLRYHLRAPGTKNAAIGLMEMDRARCARLLGALRCILAPVCQCGVDPSLEHPMLGCDACLSVRASLSAHSSPPTIPSVLLTGCSSMDASHPTAETFNPVLQPFHAMSVCLFQTDRQTGTWRQWCETGIVRAEGVARRCGRRGACV